MKQNTRQVPQGLEKQQFPPKGASGHEFAETLKLPGGRSRRHLAQPAFHPPGLLDEGDHWASCGERGVWLQHVHGTMVPLHLRDVDRNAGQTS